MTDYASNPGVNPSTLKVLYYKSALHYRHALDNPRPETDALRIGTAFHTAVLEPERFAAEYVIAPRIDKRTREGKEWWQSHVGCAVLSADEYDTIRCMVEAVRSCDAARPYLAPGRVEEPIYWTDADTGIACKGRPDLVTWDGLLTDLKSARDVSPRQFCADAAKYGYDFSMSMYVDGLLANKRPVPEAAFVAVESKAPFDVVVYRIPETELDFGREKYKSALVRLAECRRTNRWPGIAPEPVDFVLPSWAVPDEPPDEMPDENPNGEEF